MDSKEDDEISIDFSRIKNFFKAGKKEDESTESAHSGQEAKKDEEEISIDFSRIKNFFKSEGKGSKGSEEDISVNWGSVIQFFRRYGILFVMLIPIILSIYVRMQAGSLLFADEWAVNSVINGIKSQIKSSIDQQYPNLPEANKNALVDTELQRITKENKDQIDQQVKATSDYFKSFFRDETGKNYMPDIDPYYWYRYAKNVIEHGHPGDILKERPAPEGAEKITEPYDTYQLAPAGRFVTGDFFHIYFLAYFYKVISFSTSTFGYDISLMRSIFYYPVFVSALCVLLVFLIARKVAGNTGGFFAGLMMAISPALLGRTLFGHGDSDAWVVFFPLIVTWLFVETLESKSMLKIAILAALGGLFTGLFTLSWSGWWYIFDFLLGTIGFTFLYMTASRFDEARQHPVKFFWSPEIRNLIIIGIVYFVSTAIFAASFAGWLEFRNSFLGPFSFASIKSPVTPALWPNVLTTVAELNEGSVDGIINSIGGRLLFFVGLVGLLFSISRRDGFRRFDILYLAASIAFYVSYFIYRKLGYETSVFGLFMWMALPILIRIALAVYSKDSTYDFRLSILLSLWVISTMYASIKGIRFTLLLAPAFSVAFGVALGRTYAFASRWLSKELKIQKFVVSAILIAMMLIFYADPIRGAIGTAKNDVPLINDAWYNTLSYIKSNSNQDAIITSWWDFGHHFKALADRPVTFDGTTQTSHPSHWVGRMFMTSDENEAIGILRMLDCGSSKAFGYLDEIKKDTHASLKILKEIILLDRAHAEKRLKELKFNDEQIGILLQFTHCKPPEGFVIASEDMIGKSGVWSHFGSWNFERADLWFNLNNKNQEDAVRYMMDKFDYTRGNAERIYGEIQDIQNEPDSNKRERMANEWVAPWPGYAGTMSCSKESDGVYACSNGLQVNLSNKDVYGIGQEGVVRPGVAAFTTDDGLFIKSFDGTVMNFGVTFIPKSESELEAVMTSNELTGSMFTRMFYMSGHGLRYFKLVNRQQSLTGTDIYTYKVDWDGKEKNVVEDYVSKKPLMEDSKIENTGIEVNDSINANNNSVTNNS